MESVRFMNGEEEIACINLSGGTIVLEPTDAVEGMSSTKRKSIIEEILHPQEPPYKTSGYGKFVRRGSLRVVSHPGTRQGGDSTGEEPPSEEKAIRWTKRECLHVAFVHGRYYAHLGELSIDSGQSVWLRLSRDHPHWLQLMDEFRIGKLVSMCLAEPGGLGEGSQLT
ncbi:hypothetical protein FOZ63_002222, partial [Perkinsus olseni]